MQAVQALARRELATAHGAFQRIHDYYFWRVNRFIRARLRASPDIESEADDLTSDTFLQLWRQLGTFDAARGSIGSLIFIIARRLTGHRSVRNYKMRDIEVLEGSQTLPEDKREGMGDRDPLDAEQVAVDQADHAWQEENRARLMREFEAEAPDAYRLARLRYQEGLSFKEVAHQLGISSDSARQRDVAARLLLFRMGWRQVRENELLAGRSHKTLRPQSVAELAVILQDDPAVGTLFEEYFGAASWRLVSPRRDHHGHT